MSCAAEQAVSIERELYVESLVAANMPQPITWSRLRDHTAKDSVMRMLSDQISNGFPPDKKLLTLELKELLAAQRLSESG